jgi:hypothetical protein
MEYRNGDYVISSKYGLFRKHSTEDSRYVKLFIATSDKEKIEKWDLAINILMHGVIYFIVICTS